MQRVGRDEIGSGIAVLFPFGARETERLTLCRSASLPTPGCPGTLELRAPAGLWESAEEEARPPGITCAIGEKECDAPPVMEET